MAHTPAFRKLIRVLQSARRANLEAAGQPLPLPRERVNFRRRNFLKAAGITGATALVATALPGATSIAFASEPRHKASSIAIIGGGLAGLNCAYQLKKAGISSNVYEASARLGGRVFSQTGLLADGLVMEMGGEFVNTDHEDMLALVNEFNLKLFNRHEDTANAAAPASAYYFEGTAWSEEQLAELLRPLAAQITHDAGLLDSDWDANAPKFDQLSVTEYLDQHVALIPKPFIRTLIEGTIRTEYGAEPAESSALQLLFMLPTVEGSTVELLGYSDEAFTVEGGNGRIIDGLAKALHGQIHTGMALTKLESEGEKGFELKFNKGREVKADYVIIAIPFSALRHVKLELSLPAQLRKFIHEVDLGKNEKLMARYAERVWRQAGGFALEAWTDLGFAEVWDGTQRQSSRSDGALTYYLGGKEVHKAFGDGGGVTAVGNRFNHRLSGFVPGLESASTGQYVRTGWTGNPLTNGAYVNYRPGQLTSFGDFLWVESEDPDEQQAVHAGRLVFAGEHLSDEYYGFMNGGAQTGRLAAQFVRDQIMGAKAADSASVSNQHTA